MSPVTQSDMVLIGANVLAVLMIWLLIVVCAAVIMGLITHRLAGKKGYTGYFWTGFFLNIVGLIYVAGLPVRRDD